MDMSKQVRRLLAAQRDILAPPAVAALESALLEVDVAIKEKATENTLTDLTNALEAAANKWLKRYPHPGMRENVEVLLVALAVAMAIRTFFVQPFKIPTGSMQPTLFGVTAQDLRGRVAHPPPPLWQRIYEGCLFGTFYHYQVAEEDGQLIGVGPAKKVFKFINQNSITVRYRSGEKTYTFWMTPDVERYDPFGNYAGLEPNQRFKKGQEIVNFKEIAGDHLFVDRLSYNFRRPTRGEIIVFETRDIGNEYAHLPPDQFYIKRMVAMGNEKVSIGNDRHLVIDGQRLDKSTPHFENVYSFDPGQPPRSCDSVNDIRYSGHVNQYVADQAGINSRLAPLFPDQSAVYQIPPDHYMVMGDNTANSFDSRAWGEFSRTNVIGKYFFVYWPFNARFGWNVR
jgi:signal peptidase I